MGPEERLEAYKNWLIKNPEHPDYLLIWKMKTELETKKSKTYESN